MTHPEGVPEGFEPITSSNNFGRRQGPIYERADDTGWARGFLAEDKHCNSGGFVHGGMLMTFADILLARAVMDVAEPPFVTASLNSKFLRPAQIGNWIEGRAEVTDQNGDWISVKGTVTSKDETVFRATGVFKKITRPS